MDKKKSLNTYKKDSCKSCKEQDWPNKVKGRICCLSYPVKAKNYYRKDITLESEADLYKFHTEDSQEQADSYTKRRGHKVLPDDFYTWLFKRGICPYGVISPNTTYWLELMAFCDTDMGLNLPMNYSELPSTFFDVLKITRANKTIEKVDNG